MKAAASKDRFSCAQSRKGRRPMHVHTMLDKERAGTLYKRAALPRLPYENDLKNTVGVEVRDLLQKRTLVPALTNKVMSELGAAKDYALGKVAGSSAPAHFTHGGAQQGKQHGVERVTGLAAPHIRHPGDVPSSVEQDDPMAATRYSMPADRSLDLGTKVALVLSRGARKFSEPPTADDTVLDGSGEHVVRLTNRRMVGATGLSSKV